MNTKIATNREFTNNWFRIGRDPDGNVLSMMICGGNNDSYLQYVLRKQQKFKAIAESEQTFDFANAVTNGRTLFVGEGNFSFSLSIAEQISNLRNIVATTFASENDFSDLTKSNIVKLQQLGVKLFCNIDATEINKDFAGYTFDNIMFG